MNRVHHGAQAVTNGLLDLGDGVVVGTLDKDRARERIVDTLDEGVFVVTKSLFVDMSGEAKVLLSEIID